MPVVTPVGRRIKQRRTALKLSQRELARRCDLDPVTVWRYESGELSPSGDSLVLLAKALGVSLDWLMTGREAAVASVK